MVGHYNTVGLTQTGQPCGAVGNYLHFEVKTAPILENPAGPVAVATIVLTQRLREIKWLYFLSEPLGFKNSLLFDGACHEVFAARTESAPSSLLGVLQLRS